MEPTKNNVLLEVKQIKNKSGLLVEDKDQVYSEFIIVAVGPEVTDEYKIGYKAMVSIPSVPTRTVDGKQYAIVEDILINAVSK